VPGKDLWLFFDTNKKNKLASKPLMGLFISPAVTSEEKS
jgi:hypothetical protein